MCLCISGHVFYWHKRIQSSWLILFSLSRIRCKAFPLQQHFKLTDSISAPHLPNDQNLYTNSSLSIENGASVYAMVESENTAVPGLLAMFLTSGVKVDKSPPVVRCRDSHPLSARCSGAVSILKWLATLHWPGAGWPDSRQNQPSVISCQWSRHLTSQII